MSPFFSRARFGPGMIIVLSVLLVLLIALTYFKICYLAALVATVAIALFAVKYFERIQSSNPIIGNSLARNVW